SLLFDAKAELPPALREELLNHYLDALAEHIPVDRQDFREHYYPYVYVRIMQALGAYGYRGFFERKLHFLQSVPYALQNIRWLLHNVTLPIELPALMEVFSAMLGSEKLQRLAITERKELTVVVTSFSFHRGPVQDESGNGGGFVFDARSLPNPGREERFKNLSGRDAEVIEYLEGEETVSQFLENALKMVTASVRAYKERSFTHLMVSYGCTGGQHRSVYLAEQTAKRLAATEGLNVVLHHREEESWVR
ncbi:MAG: RapZ C-terminal domain-containing protein, partial [Thermoanaerobaculia bacterium]